MKLPKVTSFFLIFFFLASLLLLAQARRLQENYEDEELKAAYNGKLPAATSDFLLTLRLELPISLSLQDSRSFFQSFNGVVTYMTLSSSRSKEFGREEASPPPSPKPSDPQNPTIIISSLSSDTELGRGEKPLPPPSPEPSEPQHPTIIPSSLSSDGELGRGEKAKPKPSPPPSPKPSDPQNPTITPSGLSSAGEFGREGKSPPPAPKPHNPDHPTIITSSYGRPARSPPPAPKPGAPIHPGNSGGGQLISMANDSSATPIFLASA